MTTGADVAIAVGTIATASLALVGLAVTVYVNWKDRRQAVEVARDDRRAAAELATADRAAAREDAQRRHVVNLLLELGREVATQAAYSSSPQGGDAGNQVRLLLNALPPECAYSVRQKFGAVRTFHMPGAVGVKMQHLDLSTVAANADLDQMTTEIAYDIDWYMTSGHAPGDVWNEDLEAQKEWQRHARPRS